MPAMLPGETHLIYINVAAKDGATDAEYFTMPNNIPAHLYHFKWFAQPCENGATGKILYESFFAASLADALDRWYRFLRLTAAGAKRDEAMEICDNLNWLYNDYTFAPVDGETSRLPRNAKKNGRRFAQIPALLNTMRE